MLYILSTDDTEDHASEIKLALEQEYPDVGVQAVDGKDGVCLAEWPKWDDLLIVVFGVKQLTQSLSVLLENEVEAATNESRNARILPVSTLTDIKRPPKPIDQVKALQYIKGNGAEFKAVMRRVGVLLGLWLRGSGKKLFVSHRQSDGGALAKQIADYLIDNGYPAWLDVDNLDGGELVQQEIEQHVSGADLLLVLDTPQAGQSQWIWKEIDAAISCFVPIFPLVIKPVGESGRSTSFLALKELYCNGIDVQIKDDGICELLTDDELYRILVMLEERLVQIVRDRMKIPKNASDVFRRVDFSWDTLDKHRYMYESTKPDLGMAMLRFLSHCSVDGPTFYSSVKAFQEYTPNQPVGLAAQASAPQGFNLKLFLHDIPIPEPARNRIAQDLSLAADPLLRVLDLTELALYLERYRSSEVV